MEQTVVLIKPDGVKRGLVVELVRKLWFKEKEIFKYKRLGEE